MRMNRNSKHQTEGGTPWNQSVFEYLLEESARRRSSEHPVVCRGLCEFGRPAGRAFLQSVRPLRHAIAKERELKRAAARTKKRKLQCQ